MTFFLAKLSGSPNLKTEDKASSPTQTSLEIWTRINVDSVALTQWNENLRMVSLRMQYSSIKVYKKIVFF